MIKHNSPYTADNYAVVKSIRERINHMTSYSEPRVTEFMDLFQQAFNIATTIQLSLPDGEFDWFYNELHQTKRKAVDILKGRNSTKRQSSYFITARNEFRTDLDSFLFRYESRLAHTSVK